MEEAYCSEAEILVFFVLPFSIGVMQLMPYNMVVLHPKLSTFIYLIFIYVTE